MVYENWWGHYKKSIPYYMFCTPNNGFAKGGVSDNVKYDFEFVLKITSKTEKDGRK